tara:strand:- start:155 stop:685 length:531 start_codon:yes stop_codon:yes gene_type:complete
VLTLKCTKKAQDFIGLDKNDLDATEKEMDQSVMGGWYVNVFLVDRRKCLIFMNERSLVSFIIFGARKDNSKKDSIPELFLRGIVQLLVLEDFPPAHINRLVEDCVDYRFAKTDSRKVLGNLNDLVATYEHMIWYEGGLKHCNLDEILYRVNRTPQRNLNWGYSIDMARELLSANAT